MLRHLNRAARIRWERAVAVYLAWSLGDPLSEVEVWRRVVGTSARAYYRRLQGADTDRLRVEYPELEIAHRQAVARHQKRERERADEMEERRRAAWEQVRRLRRSN